MGEEEMLYLYQLISSMPGKTMSQKLNFFQDISKSLGIDALGGGSRDFVEEQYYDMPNEVDAVWGKDPVASALFDAVDQNMSPLQAYQAAVEQGLIQEPRFGEKAPIDYLNLVSQYAAAEAKRKANKEMFDMQQANARAVFESKAQPSWDDLFNAPTLWEAAGSPSEERLAQEFATGDTRFRSASNMAKQQAKSDVVSAGKKAVLGPLNKMIGKNLTSDKLGGTQTRFSDDPVLNEYVQRISREKARKELPVMQSRMLPTPKGEQLLRSLAILKMFGG